jgi:glycosyltransferase involved in cell wall biosynthesis
VFNGERFIENAIRSALTCGVEEVEIIVQDGGSTDRTLATVADIADRRIHVESRVDAGQADALNRALSRARGEWIVWLNADDEIAPGAVRDTLAAVSPGARAVVGDHAHIDESGKVRKRYRIDALSTDALLRRGTYAFSGSLLVATELACHIGFDPLLEFSMDFDFMLRLTALGDVEHVSVEIGRFRLQPSSKTHVSPWRMYREHFAVARRGGAYELRRLPATLRLHLEMAAYILSRPLWRSDWWMAKRPEKVISKTTEDAVGDS